MEPAAAIVSRSEVDMPTLLPIARQLLGYSLASAADAVPIPLAKQVHQLACLAAFKSKQAAPNVKTAIPQAGLLHIGILVAATDIDLVEILDLTRGMEAITTETQQRGVSAAIITGSLAQWQRAIGLACGSSVGISHNARRFYNMAFQLLVKEGLRDLFVGMRVREQADKTFLLEGY